MQPEVSTEAALTILDLGVLACAGLGFFALRRLRPPTSPDLRSAFQLLGRSIERSVPEIPRGYTWGEAFEVLKSKGFKVDWADIQSTLTQYEAYIYGCRPAPAGRLDGVVSLTLEIGRSASRKRTKK